MEVREKLVELLMQVEDNMCDDCGREPVGCAVVAIADHLIAHGVTVQECGHWEDDNGDYVCSCCHTVFTDDLVWLVRGESNEPNYCPHCGAKMMPQPPKGD